MDDGDQPYNRRQPEMAWIAGAYLLLSAHEEQIKRLARLNRLLAMALCLCAAAICACGLAIVLLSDR